LAKKTRTKLARAQARAKMSLDVKIARDKREIKSLGKKLRKRKQIHSRRLRRRAKLK
jgi:hypothetical protein